MEEQFDLDRTLLILSFNKKQAIKKQLSWQFIKCQIAVFPVKLNEGFSYN